MPGWGSPALSTKLIAVFPSNASEWRRLSASGASSTLAMSWDRSEGARGVWANLCTSATNFRAWLPRKSKADRTPNKTRAGGAAHSCSRLSRDTGGTVGLEIFEVGVELGIGTNLGLVLRLGGADITQHSSVGHIRFIHYVDEYTV